MKKELLDKLETFYGTSPDGQYDYVVVDLVKNHRDLQAKSLTDSHDNAELHNDLQSAKEANQLLVRTFMHTHEASEDDDECAHCGLDLRNPIHRRL